MTALFLEDYGLMQVASIGAWRGIFGEKNTLGRFATLALIVGASSYGDARSEGRVWHLWVPVTILAVLLVMSKSATAVLVAVILALLWPLFRALRGNRTLLVSALIFVALVGLGISAFFIEVSDTIFNSLGRDATLTGRTRLWELVLEKILERPLLGYGFGSFWLGLNGPSADVWELLGFATPHSHNGLLDLMLNIGGLGTGLFLIGFCDGLFKAIRRMRVGTQSVDVWPIAFLSFMVLYNVTESSILYQNSIYWVMYVSILMTPIPYGNDVKATAPMNRLDYSGRRESWLRPSVITS